VSRARVPDEVLDAAHARARAREARDWPAADRLKAEIEAAGWKVVDRGTDFALSPARPSDVTEGDRVRYGSSASVPSRFDDPPVGLATVVLVAHAEPEAVARTHEALNRTSPHGTSVVIVGNAPSAALEAVLDTLEAPGADSTDAADPSTTVSTEVILTSERLGPAAALNIGTRRARGPVVISLDPTVEPTGDIVTPLVDALADPTVAVAGGWGSVTRDRRRFEVAPRGDVDVVDASLIAFRRADAAERGPLDERLRTERFTAIVWSLVLRDAGEGAGHRRAVSLPGLPVRRQEGAGAAASDQPPERDLKRDFYRFLDTYGSRTDLMKGSD
jgi:cysteinyl-tRNA synthetase